MFCQYTPRRVALLVAAHRYVGIFLERMIRMGLDNLLESSLGIRLFSERHVGFGHYFVVNV